MRTPPDWSEKFATTDLDEVRALFGRFGAHRRECLGRGTLDIRWSYVSLDGAAIGWGNSSLGQRIHATTLAPLLHVPLERPATYRVGQRHFESAPGRAVFIGPGTEYTVAYGAETPVLAFQVDETVLSAWLRHRDDRGRGRPLPAAVELPLDGASIARVDGMLQELRRGAPIAPAGLEAAQLHRALASWVAALLSRGASPRRVGSLAEERLGRVEEWIEGHLADRIDLDGLCRVGGIESRGLRKSFQQRCGMAPMQWVWGRRMAAARLRLVAAQPGESVTSILHDCGLAHPGRFAVDYRQRYGESPSATLADALRRGR
jgi:AraC-like DNA-binding protein